MVYIALMILVSTLVIYNRLTHIANEVRDINIEVNRISQHMNLDEIEFHQQESQH